MRSRGLAVLATLLCLAVQPGRGTSPSWAAERSLQPASDSPVLSGTVSCPQRVTLPRTATLRVELIDLSAKDARRAVVGEDSYWIAGGKLPVSFRISYDPSSIDPRNVYVVRARVMDGETVVLASTVPYYVLTRGASTRPVDIVVVPAQGRVR